jgi:glucose/arabinose dehydrogenase
MSYNQLIESLEPRQLLATLPSGFTETIVDSGIDSPTAMAFAPDGRIFFAEKGGALRIVKNGSTLATPALTLSTTTGGERGFIGLALDPAFGTAGNNFVYVHYSVPGTPVHNRVSRFTITGDTVNSGSEDILLELDPQGSTDAHFDHNGGAIHFGPDGKLYITVGDNRQNLLGKDLMALSNLYGKVLRINKDGNIPNDNPFYETATGKYRAIWARGLRNPFSFAFQPGTGRMFINDVGEVTWEEINEGQAGANYGWPATEGPTSDPAYQTPFYAYLHEGDTEIVGCAITGGSFYNPATSTFPPEYEGDYFFSDFCTGIHRIDTATKTVTSFATSENPLFMVDVQVAPDGSLYYFANGGLPSAALYRVQYAGASAPPTITQHPQDRTVTAGESVAFSVTATGEGPFTYQWQRNGTDIEGATLRTFTVNTAGEDDDGDRFRVIVTNANGSTTSNAATLTVTANTAPRARITAPDKSLRYRAGDTISFFGKGLDDEDGSLPAARFAWRVDFHHETHAHPFMSTTGGIKSGSFGVPRAGEVSPDVWFRIHLTVTDSGGLSDSTFVDVHPRKVNMTFRSSVPGISLSLDDQPRGSEFSVTGVTGVTRELTAPRRQTVGDTQWVFDHWSDGGTASHLISTPRFATTYTAVYRVAGGSIGTGTGLRGAYFSDTRLTNRLFKRTDRTIHFDWGTSSPGTGIPADGFSVRWLGRLQGQFNDTYTLHLTAAGGVRLFIDGQLLINDWSPSGAGERTATLKLNAGQAYSIRVDYRHGTGPAGIELEWSSPRTPRSPIPRSQLYPS